MARSKGAGLGVLSEAKSPTLGLRAGRSAGWAPPRARATGPRVREVSRAAEEPGEESPPSAPRNQRTIPSRGPRTRGKKEEFESFEKYSRSRRGQELRRWSRSPPRRRAPLPPSGRGGGAAGSGSLESGAAPRPSWWSPPPPGGLCRRGPKAGGAGPSRSSGAAAAGLRAVGALA